MNEDAMRIIVHVLMTVCFDEKLMKEAELFADVMEEQKAFALLPKIRKLNETAAERIERRLRGF